MRRNDSVRGRRLKKSSGSQAAMRNRSRKTPNDSQRSLKRTRQRESAGISNNCRRRSTRRSTIRRRSRRFGKCLSRRRVESDYGSASMKIIDAADALLTLERLVAAVKGNEIQESKFGRALTTLEKLSRKEGIPIAIVGDLAAIHHGYERFTKDIDIVVRSSNLDVLARVAPHYGIKVIWKD